LYNRKSLVLLIKATGEDLSNTCKDGKRVVMEAPNLGGANACDKRRPPIKGEDTKRELVWVELSSKKSVEAPNIEIEMEDCEECTATFSFYVVSGSNISQVHMMV
jgi:hypothetical protein